MYSNKKPYLFLNDSSIESFRKPRRFQKESIWKEGIVKKPYLGEYPEESFSLLPSKVGEDPFLLSPERTKKEHTHFMSLSCKLVEFVEELGVGETALFVFEVSKNGKFYEQGEFSWEFAFDQEALSIIQQICETENQLCLTVEPLSGASGFIPIEVSVNWFDSRQAKKIKDKKLTIAVTPVVWSKLEAKCSAGILISSCDDWTSWDDNFNDNSLDLDLWILNEISNLTITEESQQLRFTSTPPAPPPILDGGYGECISKVDLSCFTQPFEITVQADCLLHGQSGTG